MNEKNEARPTLVSNPLLRVARNVKVGTNGEGHTSQERLAQQAAAIARTPPEDLNAVQRYFEIVCEFRCGFSGLGHTSSSVVELITHANERINEYKDTFDIFSALLTRATIYFIKESDGVFSPIMKEWIKIKGLNKFQCDSNIKLGAYLIESEEAKKMALETIKSHRHSKRLLKGIDVMRKILNRLEKRIGFQERISTAYDTIAEIDFFTGEYIKRKLVAEASSDQQLKELCQQAFKNLRTFFQIATEKDSTLACEMCPWSSGLDNVWGAFGLTYIARGGGCSGRKCPFNKAVVLYVSALFNEKYRGRQSFICGMEKYDAQQLREQHGDRYELFTECLDLTLRYGIYPYDLFVVGAPERFIFDAVELPKIDYFYFTEAIEKHKNRQQLSPRGLEKIAENRKKGLKQGRYVETNESRLIGLWLWDRAHADPGNPAENITRIILSLRDEEWFKKTASWKITFGNYINEQSNTFLREPIEIFRRVYDQASKSIREGAILKMS